MLEGYFEFDFDQAKAMAVFVAQLTREGVTYQVAHIEGGWRIVLTGGY